MHTIQPLLGVVVTFLGAALPAQTFVDRTASTPLAGIPHGTVSTGIGLASGDFDRDGDQDIIAAGNPGQPVFYFRNEGGIAFTVLPKAFGFGEFK